MFVVPKGVQHKPYAEQEVKLLLSNHAGCSIQDMKAASAPPRMMFGFSKRDPLPARDCGGQQTIVRKNLRPNRFHSGGGSIGNFRLE